MKTKTHLADKHCNAACGDATAWFITGKIEEVTCLGCKKTKAFKIRVAAPDAAAVGGVEGGEKMNTIKETIFLNGLHTDTLRDVSRCVWFYFWLTKFLLFLRVLTQISTCPRILFDALQDAALSFAIPDCQSNHQVCLGFYDAQENHLE